MSSEKFVYRANAPVPPGETLLEVLQFLKMSQKELAERMGRPLKLVNEIVKGKSSITTETALQLERVFGKGKEATFWLQLEAGYQEALARESEREELSSETEVAKSYPYKEMVKNGWVEDAPTSLDQTHNILSFFGVNSFSNVVEKRLFEPVAYRMSTKKKVDNFALEAWLRQGTLDAQQIETATFSKDILETKIPLIRALNLEKPEVFAEKIKEHLAEAGVSFVVTRGLTNVPVNGAARWLSGDKAVIQLSLYGVKADKFWFSLFHEIGHILLHGKRFSSVDLDGSKSLADVIEAEANEYSRNVLIPLASYRDFIRTNDFGEPAITSFAREMGILPGIVVGRLQIEDKIPFNKSNHLKSGYVWAKE